jgi:hypothetical protein
MVQRGFALSLGGLREEAAEARAAKKGFGRATFERPSGWRERIRTVRGDARAGPAPADD